MRFSLAVCAGLLYEGLAVNALTHGRICLMGGNLYCVKSAVVFVLAVIFALFYRTFDRVIGSFVIHHQTLPFKRVFAHLASITQPTVVGFGIIFSGKGQFYSDF